MKLTELNEHYMLTDEKLLSVENLSGLVNKEWQQKKRSSHSSEEPKPEAHQEVESLSIWFD